LLPTDADIELCHSLIPYQAWKNAFALMATYGLRPHEVGRIELVDLPILRVLENTKTGFRLVRPLHPHWIEKFGITFDMEMPRLTGANNSALGRRVANQFAKYKIGFPPYNLRHADAVRCSIAYQMPVAVAAKMMGHSAAIHQATYLRHVREDSVAEIYAKKVEEFKL
jgi:integrase